MVWCAWLMSIWPKTASFLSAARMVLFCCILLLSVTLYRIISFLAQSVGPSASYYCVAEVIPSYSTFRQNGRKRKISIQSLNHQGSTLHTHAEKEEAILQCASSYGASLLECSGKVLGSGTRSECGDGQMEDWWKMELANLPKQVRRTKAAILTYTAWNICKARNRWVFYSLRMWKWMLCK